MRGENERGVSDILGENELVMYVCIYISQMKALDELRLLPKVHNSKVIQSYYLKTEKTNTEDNELVNGKACLYING